MSGSRPNPVTQLLALGVELRQPEPAAGRYSSAVQRGPFLQLSGVAPTVDGRPVAVGKLGENFSVLQGQEAARLCAINLVAALYDACDGALDRVEGFLSVRGFVNAAPTFKDLPAVMDGCSVILVQVFGDDVGRHARTTVGCASLPSGVAVEVDALVVLRS